MNRFILPVITASALIFGFILPSEEAAAQTTAKDLVGTWRLVSITLEEDGKKTDFYGPNPQGQRTFDPTGRFSEIITRSPSLNTNGRQARRMNAVGGFRGSVRLPARYISEMSASALSKLLVLPKVCRAVAFAPRRSSTLKIASSSNC
jgi:hypothetical protein